MRTLRLVGLLLCFSACCHAYPTGPARVWKLLAESEEIWRGEVVETKGEEEGTALIRGQETPVQWYTATMRVDRVIKGHQPAGQGEFRFPFVNSPNSPSNHDLAKTYLIVFLSRQEGKLTVTDPGEEPAYVPRTPAEVVGEAHTPEELLAQELLRAAQGREGQEADFDQPLGWFGEVIENPALAPVAAFVAPTLQKWGETSPDGLMRGMALGILIRFNWTPSYAAAGKFLLEEPRDEATEWGQDEVVIGIQAVSDADPKAFRAAYLAQTGAALSSAITPLLHRSMEMLRSDAAATLGGLGDKSAIPALIGAVDDESPHVRSTVTIALSFLTHKYDDAWSVGLNAPPEKLAAAVALWKDWWEKTGKARYGPK